MNYSDFLKTKIVNRSGLIIIHFLFVSISLLPTINNTHAAGCTDTGPIADCFDHRVYKTPQQIRMPLVPKDPHAKTWSSPLPGCVGCYIMAVYIKDGKCPTEITIWSDCTIGSVHILSGSEIEELLEGPPRAGLNTWELRDGKHIPVMVRICFSGGESITPTITIDVYYKLCSEIVIEAGTPVPDVKAKGLDGTVTTSGADNLTVTVDLDPGSTVALDPGSLSGDSADWWVVVETPFGWYHYDVGSGSWVPGRTVTYQGPLFDLPQFEVLNMTGLPVGVYTFYFGVDMIMNGSLDMGSIYYDSVVVNITE